MEQDSLLEDITTQTPNPTPYYRFVGILRLLYSLIIVVTIISSLISFGTIIYFGVVSNDSVSYPVLTLVIKLVSSLMYIFLLFYYVPQVKYELLLSPKLYYKRAFRLFAVLLNVIFIIAFISSLYVNAKILNMGPIFTIFLSVSILLNALLVIADIKLLRGQKSFSL